MLTSFSVHPQSVTDSHTPPGLAPGAPAGSYALSGFENINHFNGNLNFRLPLLQVGGRGQAQHTMLLPIEQHWTVQQIDGCPGSDFPCPQDFVSSDWWSATRRAPFGPGMVEGRYGKDHLNHQCHGVEPSFRSTLTRLTFTAPDGTEYELRDELTGGQFATVDWCRPTSFSRGRVFTSIDGAAMTFISDYDIGDEWTLHSPGSPTNSTFLPSGYLLMRDGTRYRINHGLVDWIRDRNGNQINFSYDGYKVSRITDSLNRQVSIAYGNPTVITYSGFGGAERTIRVHYTNLGSALRSDYPGPAKTIVQLFANAYNDIRQTHDPQVVSSVEVPDNRRYQFYYNYYGELARVELPTGGTYEYDFRDGSGSVESLASQMIYRRVVERRVYTGRSSDTLIGKSVFPVPAYTAGSLNTVAG